MNMNREVRQAYDRCPPTSPTLHLRLLGSPAVPEKRDVIRARSTGVSVETICCLPYPFDPSAKVRLNPLLSVSFLVELFPNDDRG